MEVAAAMDQRRASEYFGLLREKRKWRCSVVCTTATYQFLAAGFVATRLFRWLTAKRQGNWFRNTSQEINVKRELPRIMAGQWCCCSRELNQGVNR